MTKITTSAIDYIINCHTKYKEAKLDFEDAKKLHCSELEPGTYRGSAGYLTKGISQRPIVDYKRMIEELGIDVSKYTVVKDVETISVHNLNHI